MADIEFRGRDFEEEENSFLEAAQPFIPQEDKETAAFIAQRLGQSQGQAAAPSPSPASPPQPFTPFVFPTGQPSEPNPPPAATTASIKDVLKFPSGTGKTVGLVALLTTILGGIGIAIFGGKKKRR